MDVLLVAQLGLHCNLKHISTVLNHRGAANIDRKLALLLIRGKGRRGRQSGWCRVCEVVSWLVYQVVESQSFQERLQGITALPIILPHSRQIIGEQVLYNARMVRVPVVRNTDR